MPEKMLKTAGRYTDENGIERASAPYVSEEGIQRTAIDTTVRGETNQYLNSSYISDILETPLTGEIFKNAELKWFIPLVEVTGEKAHDFSGNKHTADIFGESLELTDDLPVIRYASKTENDRIGKLNVFGARGIRNVRLPDTASVAGKSTITFQCVFEPNDEETNQVLYAEQAAGSTSAAKIQVSYNFGGDKKITAGFRTKDPSEQSFITVKSSTIPADRKLILVHVVFNLTTKQIKIYVNGELDSTHTLEFEGSTFDNDPRVSYLGNTDPFGTSRRLSGQAGFFAVSESELKPELIRKQYQSFFKKIIGEGGEEASLINGYYEIHVDDSILCLEELDANKDTYTSIFEGEILKKYKETHDKYGTVFNLSLFYEIVENGAFGIQIPSDNYRIGWTLSNMTDKFKQEFKDNAHWLKFSFHSENYDIRYGENPELSAWDDYKKVREEVFRFAGREAWEDYYTKLHWYSGTETQLREMADNGVHRYIGSAQHSTLGSFSLTAEKTALMHEVGYYENSRNDTHIHTGAGVLERILGVAPRGVGTPMTMDVYLPLFMSGTVEEWSKPTDSVYFSIETHEQWFIGDMAVINQIEVASKWFYENNIMPAFYRRELMSLPNNQLEG